MQLPAWRHPRNLTVQTRIVLLVIACILPASLLVAFVTYLSYERERSNIAQHTLATTRELMRVVERELGANVAAAQALSHSVDIDRGDFAAFYSEAKEVLRYTSGFTIVLTDASAQQVVNLLQPFGAPLPHHGSPELLRRVLDTRQPVVSDLFVGGVTGKPLLAIEVPVIRDGRALYGLALGIDPRHLGEVLSQQGLPPEWIVSIFDSTGTIIARTHAPEQYVGQKGSPALMRAMLQAQEGVLDTPTLEGIPVMAAFSRSPAYGWTVAIGVPEAILSAGLRRWLALYAVGGILLLLAGLGMAIVIGRSITQPIRTLVAPALDIGKGESVAIPPLDLKEADEVRQALLKAQLLLRQREQERDAAEKSEHQMQLAKEVAEQSAKAKAAFLANVSHELRTPLNAILGFSRLMRNAPDVTPEQARNFDIINRSGEYLLHLINGVLDATRIESGYTALQETEFDLLELLHELRSLMQVPAAEKGLRLTMALSPALPRHVNADAGKLRQVLINLVGNALKFTTSGGVSLRAGLARMEPPEHARIRFEVEDTGPGIREEDMPAIFSRFENPGDKTTADTGCGLGLYLSKQYVGLMGGAIGVTSAPGRGSVFHFEIPVATVRAPPADASNKPLHAPADEILAGALDAAQLETLPVAILEELHEAAVLLDGARCLEVITKIDRIEATLGAQLRRMVDQLQYHVLLARLDPILARTTG